MGEIKDDRMVFIFDECHRSQFGETHKKIKEYFSNIQLFGFTGTPIFAENAVKNDHGKRTTKELFDECLHKYVITDAIKDENVLKFSVEYVGRYKSKDDSKNFIDIDVEDIDTKELLEDQIRLEKIADYIIAVHGKKTHSKTFTGMFCVSSVDVLIKYYEIFRKKQLNGEHNLKIATIFSYAANEEDKGADGSIPEEVSVVEDTPRALYGLNQHSREKLDQFISHYNEQFGTKYSTRDQEDFYNYYKDISKRVREKQVDILLVVNMFLTGFDSPNLNTLYVDKNLKYHGLIQAYSRTNRILNELKSQGNIVVFRNLKQATDDAITLFSNKEAIDVIIMEPLEDYEEKFNQAVSELKAIAPTVNSVNNLTDEEQELAFVKAFRALMRLKNTMTAFTDFDWEHLEITPQEFEDYKSKYLDLYEKVKGDHQPEKVSILEDVDFELELIHRDEINVAYILKLLANLKGAKPEDQEKRKKEIIDLLSGEAKLRSKRELIEKFIQENLPEVKETEDILDEFERFWSEEQIKAFDQLVKEEQLSPEKTQVLIENYLFSEREPIRDEVLELIEGEKPKALQRKSVGNRILKRVIDFVETFIENLN
jgi:type I restriction enzyme, R subunit